MHQLLSLLRVPKIFHLNRLLSDQMSMEAVETVRMWKVLMSILVMCHYNACLWYLVGEETVRSPGGGQPYFALYPVFHVIPHSLFGPTSYRTGVK